MLLVGFVLLLLQARTEAEHLRQECHKLRDELDRKQAELKEAQVTTSTTHSVGSATVQALAIACIP